MKRQKYLTLILAAIVMFSGCGNFIGARAVHFSDESLPSLKMYEAAFNDNVALAKESLAMGESPNRFSSNEVAHLSAKWKRECNPLAMAVNCHSYEVAGLLLESGGNADVLDVDGATLLEVSNIEFAKKLVEYGADINRRNQHGENLFQVKASMLEGDELLEWVKLCYENGWQASPKEIAAGFDDNPNKPYEMINYFRSNIPGLKIKLSKTDELFYKAAFGKLKRREADITARNSRNETLINIAAKYGNINNVKLLYEKGADIRVKSYNGLYDALDYAIENGHLEVIKFFAEKGEGIIRRDDYIFITTERNLMECGEKGYYDCLKYLLDTFEIYNKEDVTFGAVRTVKTGNLQILDLFLDYGADIDKVANDCLINGDVETAEFLVKRGVDFSKFDNALYYAIDSHSEEEGRALAAFLIEKYPSLIETDTDALPEAITKGSVESVKLLIESGIDINKRYYDKKLTALMCASDSTDEIYEYLLSAGADITLKDAEGKTAQDHLNYYGCTDYKKLEMLNNTVSI